MVRFALPTFDDFSSASVDSVIDDPDAALMLGARSSLESAFSALFRHHAPSLRLFFQRQGAQEEADDLVQDTFLRLFHYRERYQASGRFSNFLLTLARHAWTDHWRKRTRRDKTLLAYGHELTVREASTGQVSQSWLDLEELIAQLSVKHREIVSLYFHEGLQLQEIADRLRVPLGTVKSRINHAVRGLRELVDALHDSEMTMLSHGSVAKVAN